MLMLLLMLASNLHKFTCPGDANRPIRSTLPKTPSCHHSVLAAMAGIFPALIRSRAWFTFCSGRVRGISVPSTPPFIRSSANPHGNPSGSSWQSLLSHARRCQDHAR